MTTIAYIRVSTNKQDEKSQRHIISEARIKVDEWVYDISGGGNPWQKRQLAEILRNATPGDTIVVSEISRIARSTIGVLTFLQAAAEARVNVQAIRSGIKLDDSPASKIVVVVLALAAEIDRDLLKERTRAALQARKARGLPIGRQTGSIGKSNKLDGRREQINQLLEAKVSKSAIARIFSVSRTTLHSFLKHNNLSD